MKKGSSIALHSPNSLEDSSSRTVKKMLSNTSNVSGMTDERPRIIIGKESLLHYEPNKPLINLRSSGKKEAASLSERKMEKPIHIVNKATRMSLVQG